MRGWDLSRRAHVSELHDPARALLERAGQGRAGRGDRARGKALLAEFGDDAAKPRLEKVLRKESRQVTGSRTGSVGFVRIVPMTGPMAGKVR
ncbi:hypothetical protein H1235_01015 [Pseudoxanthomonas sp. NC8]|nr:hypothetical protein H1235_01015 [Pseudoxanthomonas sp. NC8]